MINMWLRCRNQRETKNAPPTQCGLITALRHQKCKELSITQVSCFFFFVFFPVRSASPYVGSSSQILCKDTPEHETQSLVISQAMCFAMFCEKAIRQSGGGGGDRNKSCWNFIFIITHHTQILFYNKLLFFWSQR